MVIRPQKVSTPISQTAKDDLEQTEMIFQDVRKNAMQAYIKYKAFYDTKTEAKKLKPADNVYVLQLKSDHQGSKTLFTQFPWFGVYIFEKVVLNKNSLLRKFGSNNTQKLHQIRLR